LLWPARRQRRRVVRQRRVDLAARGALEVAEGLALAADLDLGLQRKGVRLSLVHRLLQTKLG
jgi:hypothetical protein